MNAPSPRWKRVLEADPPADETAGRLTDYYIVIVWLFQPLSVYQQVAAFSLYGHLPRKDIVYKTSANTIQFIPQFQTDRFFVAPKFGKTADTLKIKTHFKLQEEAIKQKHEVKKMDRYAAYVRVSSEEQVGNFSIDAQRRAIEVWVKQQGGKLVKIYADEGKSGRTADRPEFQNMRRDARKGKFDALVVHKFDRFARNRTDALAIKSLLRHEYGIKVYSATEPSEDSDGAIGALIEGIMESVADWYSRNLSSETTKGKKERATQGYHNNLRPFGLNSNKGVLTINEEEIDGLRLAFELYATGKYSDNAIAWELERRGYKSTSGRPFSTDTIRHILRNRVYIGYVRYKKHIKRPDGTIDTTTPPLEWFKGQHDPVIPIELFERCQKIRAAKAVHHEYYPKHRDYLLRDIAFCAECVENMPDNNQDENYGKMRPQTNASGKFFYYRCRARDQGRTCSQTSANALDVEQQVVDILMNLKPPEDWRNRMVNALGQLIGDQNLEERIATIKTIIERMDFRWDQGFITDKDQYLEERIKLQQELEQLTPIPGDELEKAADILENFEQHWIATGMDRKAQQKLLQLIVARVWIRDNQVVAISLRPNYHVTVGLESTKLTEMSFVHRRGERDSNPPSRP